jgi:hypothetical protein
MDMTRLDMAILEKFGNDHTLEEELCKLYGLRAFSRSFKGEGGQRERRR